MDVEYLVCLNIYKYKGKSTDSSYKLHLVEKIIGKTVREHTSTPSRIT
jgi:hypothetical protein